MLDVGLGPFLRSRREALAPEDVGLPRGPRRRTPGLRRAEVATLAGISVDYLVRLEQGRDRRPSGQVLAALAAALRLDEADRALLRQLAAASLGPELCPAGTPARQVRPTVEALLRRLEPAPAFVLNRLADLLAWTEAYAALAQPLGILDGEPPNLVRYTFTDARARDTYPDWDAIADEQVANLRVGCRTTDPASAALLDDLTRAGGAAFADRWAGPALEVKASGTKRLTHPEVGELAVAFETLQLPDVDDQRLVVYLAADEVTAAALDRLAGRGPARLRAVPG